MSEEVIVVEAEEVEPIINEYEKYEINKTMAVDLAKGLPSIIKERETLLSQVDAILVLDKDDPNTAKKAAELRKRIKKNRSERLRKWKETTKEVYLRAGQFVDALYKREVAINEQAEGQLEAIERYAENLERQRLEALHQERLAMVAVYVDDVSTLPNLSGMDQEVFEAYLQTKKNAFEAKIAAEKKAEGERLERERIQNLHNERFQLLLPLWQFVENKDANLGILTQEEFDYFLNAKKIAKAEFEKEQERIRLENQKLKEEADKKEAELKKQRETQEAILAEERKKAQEAADKERKEKEALEAELKKKKDQEQAELAAKKAAEEAEKQMLINLSKAGDKSILLAWARQFSTVSMTGLDGLSELGKAKVEEITSKQEAFCNWALKQIEAL